MPELHARIFSLDNPQDCLSWDSYAKKKDTSLGYFTISWLQIIHRAFKHRVFPLAVEQEGKVRGILPLVLVSSKLFGRFLVSVPFVNYGGVLADDSVVTQALLRHAETLRDDFRAGSLEFRHCKPMFPNLHSVAAKDSMLLDLPEEPGALWKSFKDKVRNQVRKAIKSGLTVDEGSKELLDDFYSVFCVNMRDLGTPVYSRNFFSTVLDVLPESTRIFCVRRQARCIAAGITYNYGDTMQMPWASSLVAERSFCPNHILYWEAIREASEKGFRVFDFGRSTPQSGPWLFKRQWGARPLHLHWEYSLADGQTMPELNVANPKFNLARAAWKLLPLPVANVLGPQIVRYIP